jgi:hypothetical protein
VFSVTRYQPKRVLSRRQFDVWLGVTQCDRTGAYPLDRLIGRSGASIERND